MRRSSSARRSWISWPTPGQEIRNAQFLETGGAAVHADSIDTVATTVSRWLGDPAARERVRENAARLARPHAAEAIAQLVLAAIRKHG